MFKPLTIFPLSGSRMQISKQLICGYSFGVDISPYWLLLHDRICPVEGLQDLQNKQKTKAKNDKHKENNSTVTVNLIK